MKKILIIGSWNTTHIRRFLSIISENKDANLIIDAFDPVFDMGQGNECGVDNIYRIKVNKLERRLYKIRKIGTYLFSKKVHRYFETIIQREGYNLVNVHQIPKDVYSYVKIAHKHGIKTMLSPLGSDVLRVPAWTLSWLRKAFAETDFVSLPKHIGFCKKVCDIMRVSEAKIVDLGYGSETILELLRIKEAYTRQQCIDILGVPYSDYYICCGYNASKEQRHSIIIEAIAKNKNLLPEKYCLLVPLSYGMAKQELHREISDQCQRLGLNAYFIMDYLTVKQVAMLRLITDLLIHVQTTDAYNASLQECLLAGSQVVNGSWLPYPNLEIYGMPYHVCDTIETLPDILAKVFTNRVPNIKLHPSILEAIKSSAWDVKISAWLKFYKQTTM